MQECVLCSAFRVLERAFSAFKGLSCVLEPPQQFFLDTGGILEMACCLKEWKEFENCLVRGDILKAIRLCLIRADVMCAVNLIVSTVAVKWF